MLARRRDLQTSNAESQVGLLLRKRAGLPPIPKAELDDHMAKLKARGHPKTLNGK